MNNKYLTLAVGVVCLLSLLGSTDALRCMKCDTTSPNPAMQKCKTSDTLPMPEECGNDAVCTYQHISFLNGTAEKWRRDCGPASDYNNEKNVCYNRKEFGVKTISCTCNKDKDKTSNACNGGNVMYSITTFILVSAVAVAALLNSHPL